MYELLGDGVIVITASLYGYEDIESVYWQCEMVDGKIEIILIMFLWWIIYFRSKLHLSIFSTDTICVHSKFTEHSIDEACNYGCVQVSMEWTESILTNKHPFFTPELHFQY